MMLKQRIDACELMLNVANAGCNLEAQRRLSWELTTSYVEMSMENLEFNYNYTGAMECLDSAIKMLKNSKMADEAVKNCEVL